VAFVDREVAGILDIIPDQALRDWNGYLVPASGGMWTRLASDGDTYRWSRSAYPWAKVQVSDLLEAFHDAPEVVQNLLQASCRNWELYFTATYCELFAQTVFTTGRTNFTQDGNGVSATLLNVYKPSGAEAVVAFGRCTLLAGVYAVEMGWLPGAIDEVPVSPDGRFTSVVRVRSVSGGGDVATTGQTWLCETTEDWFVAVNYDAGFVPVLGAAANVRFAGRIGRVGRQTEIRVVDVAVAWGGSL